MNTRALLVLGLLLMCLSACGAARDALDLAGSEPSAEDDSPATTWTPFEDNSSTSTASLMPTTSSMPSSTTSTSTTTTTTSTTTTAVASGSGTAGSGPCTHPGEPPNFGKSVLVEVVDIPANDPDGGLNLRDGVGTQAKVGATVPNGTQLLATGDCVVATDKSIWWELEYQGLYVVWASATYLQVVP